MVADPAEAPERESLNSIWTKDTDIGPCTDASNSGWGAYYGTENRRAVGTWTPEEQELSIEHKELFALLAAWRTWGHMWSKLRIRIHCDNKPVVDCVSTGTSQAPRVMELLRTLFLVCALSNFQISAVHVAGVSNCVADSLSGHQMEEFRRLAPAARDRPNALPWDARC